MHPAHAVPSSRDHARSRHELLDPGFSLVELLVVLVVVGVLAAVAVPVFLTQRAKAVDAVTQEDLSGVGRAVLAHFTDAGATAPAITLAGGAYRVGDEVVSRVADGVVVAGTDPGAVDTTGWTASAWCVHLTNPSGAQRTYRYSARAGLQAGACTSSTQP